jgi:hypothetical protein
VGTIQDVLNVETGDACSKCPKSLSKILKLSLVRKNNNGIPLFIDKRSIFLSPGLRHSKLATKFPEESVVSILKVEGESD